MAKNFAVKTILLVDGRQINVHYYKAIQNKLLNLHYEYPLFLLLCVYVCGLVLYLYPSKCFLTCIKQSINGYMDTHQKAGP